MAYKEKLEQQDSQRRRKFSTHLDIPDRDVLFRSEVSIPFYYGYHRRRKTPCPKEKPYSYYMIPCIPNVRGLRSSDNSVIGAFIHWPLFVIARMCVGRVPAGLLAWRLFCPPYLLRRLDLRAGGKTPGA
jgi:hypothetical protein